METKPVWYVSHLLYTLSYRKEKQLNVSFTACHKNKCINKNKCKWKQCTICIFYTSNQNYFQGISATRKW